MKLTKETFYPFMYKVKLDEKIFFTEHLKVMLKGGLALGTALTTLQQQGENKYFKLIITNLTKDVEAGHTFADSLTKYPKVFTEIFVNMVKAGEASGKLEDVLQTLTNQMKKDHEIISRVKSALTYPTVILSAMLIVGVIMMTYVIPKTMQAFSEIGADLPLATKIIIFLSDSLVNYGPFIAIGLVIIVITFLRLIKTDKGRYYWHAFLLKLPVGGKIISKINLARFARSLSSLLKTDVPIVDTFQITSKVVGNKLYEKSLIDAAETLKKGMSVEKVLQSYGKLYPPVIVQMVAVGEKTGTLDTILETIATFYEEDVENTMKNFSTIIEPILLLVMGGAVAVVAIAIIMPTYSLIDKI